MAAALASTGCAAPPADRAADSARASVAASDPTSALDTTGAPSCPMEGNWTACAVEERLKRAGVVIEKQADPVQHPFMSVPGATYHIGNAEHELEVFLYPSAEARARDTAALDSTTVSPRGTRVAWRTPPTLVVSNNLAAIILSFNDRTVERLTLALAAGLPEPEKR
ncbi:MAG: hypothetical protein IPF98_21270 [Gemmatimonadetes bacterium]|nr:hypothetical protein [Gemmatimonadota bacterium]